MIVRNIIWLDDFRDPFMYGNSDRLQSYKDTYDYFNGVETPKDDWVLTWVKNSDEFKEMVDRLLVDNRHEVAVISFDNDLGVDSLEGRECFSWMETLIHERNITKSFWMTAHSNNPSAVQSINLGIRALEKFWASVKPEAP